MVRSNGPTVSTTREPAATTSSGPLSVKLRAATPVPGRATRARGISAGATARLPARSRTETLKA